MQIVRIIYEEDKWPEKFALDLSEAEMPRTKFKKMVETMKATGCLEAKENRVLFFQFPDGEQAYKFESKLRQSLRERQTKFSNIKKTIE